MQIPRVHEVVTDLRIPIFTKEGFEADDVLGTLSLELAKRVDGVGEVIIVTGDLDTLQLVDSHVKVYTMRKGITDIFIYDEKAVRERYGLNPNQMVDYKALRGDPSDNIPGVTGIGEKTASELIQQFKSLDGLYKAIESGKAEDKIKPRVLGLLKEQKKQALQSYELSQIVRTVPLEVVVPPYELDSQHRQKIIALFQELEFKSLVPRLPEATTGSGEPSEAGAEALPGTETTITTKFEQNYTLVNTPEKLHKLLPKLSKAEELAVDTETTGLDAIDARLLGVSLSFKEGEAYYLLAEIIDENFKEILSNKKINKIGHNLKYDFLVLQTADYQLKPLFFDTMIASYLLNPGSRQHNLDSLAFNDLGYQMQSIEELIGKGKKQISMAEVPVEKVSWYSAEDADMTLRLKNIYEPQLKEEGLNKIFYDIEMPLIEVLADMERNGIKVDVKFLNKLSGEAEISIKNLEQDIYKLAGQEFNLNSPKQLKEVLFEKLKLEPIENKKTKTGLSTAAGELEKMVGQHPIIEKMLEYRELSKLQSTYLLALPELVNKKTGRIHTSYNQTIAATGRLFHGPQFAEHPGARAGDGQ